LVGCRDRRVSGYLGEPGSTIVGFHVERSVPPAELALAGEHRFSRYALTFEIDSLGDGRSRLRAVTDAEFPGAKGSAYRALVIGTRLHVVATRSILARVRSRAERAGVRGRISATEHFAVS
jgi:hypothetical protein